MLLSALLYPGVGHYFLKRYVKCGLFVFAFSIPLIFVLNDVIDKANQVVEKITSGEIPLNSDAITVSISNLMTETNAQELNINIYVMIFIWIIAIADAYLVSKQTSNYESQ